MSEWPPRPGLSRPGGAGTALGRAEPLAAAGPCPKSDLPAGRQDSPGMCTWCVPGMDLPSRYPMRDIEFEILTLNVFNYYIPSAYCVYLRNPVHISSSAARHLRRRQSEPCRRSPVKVHIRCICGTHRRGGGGALHGGGCAFAVRPAVLSAGHPALPARRVGALGRLPGGAGERMLPEAGRVRPPSQQRRQGPKPTMLTSARQTSRPPGVLPTTEAASVFAYSLFIAWVEFPSHPPGPVPVPAAHWQGAAGRRTLTPQEQAARESYFERRAAEAMARIGGG